MNLRPATNLACALVECGLEIIFAEIHARKFKVVHVLAKLDSINERRTKNFEGTRGAAAFAHVSGFEQAHARINDSGIESRHIGARQNPREARLVVPHLFIVAFHTEHVEFTLGEAFFLELDGEFANGLCMTRADAVEPHETRVVQIQHRAFFVHAVDGVRTIHHNDGDSSLFAGFHTKEQCPDERVVAGTHILQVHEHHVHMGKHFGSGLTMFAVKAINGNAQFGVGITFPFDHVVLGVPLDAVLRAKKGRKLKKFAVVFFEQIEGVVQIRENRCRV